jgi:hypothetical protein
MPPVWARLLGIVLLLPCFVGVYDAVIVITSWQRLQRAAATVADSVIAGDGTAETDFSPYFASAQNMARPDDVTHDGAVIISAMMVSGEGDSSVVWQRRSGGEAPSAYGAPGGPPVATGGAGFLGAGPMIGAELVAPVSPWVVGRGLFPGMIPARLHAAVLRRALHT